MTKNPRIWIVRLHLVLAISFVFIIILSLTGCDKDKFKNIKSTDLSDESINGISLMEKYSLSAGERAFGKGEEVTFEDTNTKGFSFNSEECVGAIALDKDNTITSVSCSTLKDTLHTKQGITSNKSSFDDIIKAYGRDYLKVVMNNDEPGSGGPSNIGYSVTYIDKENNYKLEFVIFEFKSKQELKNIRLWKYN